MKDHLVIVLSVIISVVKRKEENVALLMHNLETALDSLCLEDCMISFYDTVSGDGRDENTVTEQG